MEEALVKQLLERDDNLSRHAADRIVKLNVALDQWASIAQGISKIAYDMSRRLEDRKKLLRKAFEAGVEHGVNSLYGGDSTDEAYREFIKNV